MAWNVRKIPDSVFGNLIGLLPFVKTERESMSIRRDSELSVRVYRQSGRSTIAILGLTAVHHIDGAIVYHTPWRLHVAVAAPLVALAILGALYAGGSRRGTRAGAAWTRIAGGLILIIPVGLIGLIEGAYNHLAKVLIYFALGGPTARSVFPAPTYEMPSNLFFEATGIAQFPLALVAGFFGVALLRKSRNARWPLAASRA